MLILQILGEQYISSILEGLLYSFFALLVGIISSALGVGGGFITTPSLILMGIDPSYAIGTVLFMIIFTALSSTFAYSRQPDRIEYRTGLLVASMTIIGAIIGSITSSYLAETLPQIFRVLFAICLIPVAIKMIILPKRKNNPQEDNIEIEHDEVIWFGFEQREVLSTLLGFIAGFASGLLGIGGGVLMVPIFVHVGRMSIHKSIATSCFVMIFTSIAGALVKISMGQIYPDLALFLIIGIIFGAQIGPRIIRKLDTVILQRIFGFMAIIALISIAIGRDQVVFFLQGIISLFS